MDKDCNCAIFQYGTCINCGKPAFTGNPTKTNGEGQIDRIPALLAEIEELKRERDKLINKAAFHATDGETEANALLAVSAREAVPALLAEIEELKRENKALKVLREERPNLQVALRKAEARADALQKENADLVAQVGLLRRQMERIIGEHNAPSDCYSTGPLTGDPVTDMVSCPSCEGLDMLKSLPIPGSAQRRDEEVRREAIEDVAKWLERRAAGWRKNGSLRGGTYAIESEAAAKDLRAACEKGGENG